MAVANKVRKEGLQQHALFHITNASLQLVKILTAATYAGIHVHGAAILFVHIILCMHCHLPTTALHLTDFYNIKSCELLVVDRSQ